MSVTYASTTELTTYLQIGTLDNNTATLALQVASALFSTRANTMFNSTSVTWSMAGTGGPMLLVPYRPIISIDAVRITRYGSQTPLTITDYRLIKQTMFRAAGWGAWGAFPPDLIEVDLHHGYVTPGDDVKGAVLETAAIIYQAPDVTVSKEQIDDYSITYSGAESGVALTPSAAMLADLYRGTFAV